MLKANRRNTESSQNYMELCTNGKVDERIGIPFESHSEAENWDGFSVRFGLTGQLVRITSSLCIVCAAKGCLL